MNLTEDNIGLLVRSARLEAGMAKSTLALAAGTSRSALDEIEKGNRIPRVDTFLRLLKATDRSIASSPALHESLGGRPSLASFVNGLDCADAAWAWRALVSDFVANEFVPATRSTRHAMLGDKPASVGSHQWNLFIAALAEHLAFHAQIEVPGWVVDHAPPLAQFWWPVHGELRSMRAAALAKSPASFKRRRILIDGSELPEVVR